MFDVLSGMPAVVRQVHIMGLSEDSSTGEVCCCTARLFCETWGRFLTPGGKTHAPPPLIPWEGCRPLDFMIKHWTVPPTGAIIYKYSKHTQEATFGDTPNIRHMYASDERETL